MTLQATGKSILIRKLSSEEQEREHGDTGIILSDSEYDVLKQAEVISIGKLAQDELPEITPGCKIYFQDVPCINFNGQILIEIKQVFARIDQ